MELFDADATWLNCSRERRARRLMARYAFGRNVHQAEQGQVPMTRKEMISTVGVLRTLLWHEVRRATKCPAQSDNQRSYGESCNRGVRLADMSVKEARSVVTCRNFDTALMCYYYSLTRHACEELHRRCILSSVQVPERVNEEIESFRLHEEKALLDEQLWYADQDLPENVKREVIVDRVLMPLFTTGASLLQALDDGDISAVAAFIVRRKCSPKLMQRTCRLWARRLLESESGHHRDASLQSKATQHWDASLQSKPKGDQLKSEVMEDKSVLALLCDHMSDDAYSIVMDYLLAAAALVPEDSSDGDYDSDSDDE
ncbi:MAG: hypothetical protein MHM6MM_003312 [Cercozoa sp. M6MM]